MNENELIGRLLEEEKYKFVDHRIIAEVVRDVYKLQAIPENDPYQKAGSPVKG